MEQFFHVLLILVAVAILTYFVAIRRGKRLGKEELFNEICTPYKESSGRLSDINGMTFEYSTKFLHQKIILEPEFQHPFGGECHHR